MFTVPKSFSINGAEMLQHTKWLLEETEEDGSSLIAIHPSLNKLLTALRTAVANVASNVSTKHIRQRPTCGLQGIRVYRF
jgi:hypothetical protein